MNEDDIKVTLTTVVGSMGLESDGSQDGHLDGPGAGMDVLHPLQQLTADTRLSSEVQGSTDSTLGPGGPP